MNRAELRREFPVEVAPPIFKANGTISRGALRWRFSANGCPHANVEVAVAVLKAGGSPSAAIALAMLAEYVAGKGGPSIDCIERTAGAMLYNARREHAERYPFGKESEDQAARIEDRPSRWGTDEFHNGGINEHRTNWYPYAPRGPVKS